MAYNNNYYPYQQQYHPQYPQQQENGIIWVQGEAAARAYMVAPGRSVMLLDADSNTFYIKSADTSGMPQPLRIFDYTERAITQAVEPTANEIDTSQFVTRKELEERLESMAIRKEIMKKDK